MKKLQFAILLALTGMGVLAQSAQAATTTYNTGDLFLGFRQVGNSTADILIDLGPAANFRDNSSIGSLNSIIGTGLGSLLASSFGAGWYTDSNVRWGITGTSGTSLVTINSIVENPNTLYISNPETSATPPVSDTNATQNLATNAILTMKNQWIGKTVPTGLLNGFVETPGTNSWAGMAGNSFGDTQYGAFESSPNVASAMDLYRLTRSSSTSAADGIKGTFTIDSSGQVFYGAAVPEPTTAISLLGGTGMLLLSRRRRVAQVA